MCFIELPVGSYNECDNWWITFIVSSISFPNNRKGNKEEISIAVDVINFARAFCHFSEKPKQVWCPMVAGR